MIPFNFLYVTRHRMPINWNILEEKVMLGPDMLAVMEKIVKNV